MPQNRLLSNRLVKSEALIGQLEPNEGQAEQKRDAAMATSHPGIQFRMEGDDNFLTVLHATVQF
jgi:hypothetical protein